jgi:hypothetical protein
MVWVGSKLDKQVRMKKKSVEMLASVDELRERKGTKISS